MCFPFFVFRCVVRLLLSLQCFSVNQNKKDSIVAWLCWEACPPPPVTKIASKNKKCVPIIDCILVAVPCTVPRHWVCHQLVLPPRDYRIVLRISRPVTGATWNELITMCSSCLNFFTCNTFFSTVAKTDVTFLKNILKAFFLRSFRFALLVYWCFIMMLQHLIIFATFFVAIAVMCVFLAQLVPNMQFQTCCHNKFSKTYQRDPRCSVHATESNLLAVKRPKR